MSDYFYKDFVVHCPTFDEGITETKVIKAECFQDEHGIEVLTENAHRLIENTALGMRVDFLYRKLKELRSMLSAEPSLRINYEARQFPVEPARK